MTRLAAVVCTVLFLMPMLAAGEESWIRSRYQVAAAPGVPAAAYTIIESLDDSRLRRVRVLFNQSKEMGLRIDLRIKQPDPEQPPTSRWIDIVSVPGGDSLSLAIVAGQVEIHRPTRLVATYDRHGAAPKTAMMQLRSELSAPLLAGLESFVRIGFAREAAFHEEARVLARALFPDLDPPPLDSSLKTELMAISNFDPAQHPPLPGEAIFGHEYRIPVRD